jgi:hypothetical protein
MAKAARTLRDLRIAARDGDRAAVRALLKRYHWPELAREVHHGKPIPPRVTKMVRVLTAGVGTHDQLDEWEYRNEAGEIVSLLLPDPPPPHMAYKSRPILED